MRKAITAMIFAFMCMSAHAADLGYDPEADPFEQYHQAIAEAEATNKLVLIVAGGEWCRWCYVLNRFVEKNPDVEQRLRDTFVVMKVYVGPGNFNEMFFSQLPVAYGAPHFWIVSPQREVLASQSTAKLERGKNTYDKASFLAFIDEWRSKIQPGERHARSKEEAAAQAPSG
jgi:hypothetical protein